MATDERLCERLLREYLGHQPTLGTNYSVYIYAVECPLIAEIEPDLDTAIDADSQGTVRPPKRR